MNKFIVVIAFVLTLSACKAEKEVVPTYDIDLLEVYSHAQMLVDEQFFVNDYYTYVEHPTDETKVYFVTKVSEELYTIDSWVEWINVDKYYGNNDWHSEVIYKKGVFESVTIEFN